MQTSINLESNTIYPLREALKEEIDRLDEKYLELLYKMISALRPTEESKSKSLDIEVISPDDPDYKIVLDGIKEYKEHPENFLSMDDIDWR